MAKFKPNTPFLAVNKTVTLRTTVKPEGKQAQAKKKSKQQSGSQQLPRAPGTPSESTQWMYGTRPRDRDSPSCRVGRGTWISLLDLTAPGNPGETGMVDPLPQWRVGAAEVRRHGENVNDSPPKHTPGIFWVAVISTLSS